MNVINNLFDKKYIIDLFKKEILPKYPAFINIKNIKIIPHKKHIWEKTYHVVIEFKTSFLDKGGKQVVIPIFCSAHSSEPRENVYKALNYLWDNGFADESLTIPRPIFYSKEFKGTFYRGVEGRNLYQYIRENNLKEIENIIPRAAGWFSKLHSLPTANAFNFNKENSRIKTVFPGKDGLLQSIKDRYPEYLEYYANVYGYFIKNEEEFLDSTKKRWLVHGDAHPENIIKINDKKLGVIDFTDLCLSDFARDLGTFLQQIEFMIMRKIDDQRYANKVKKLFLEEYLKNAKIKLSNSLQKRIDNYYFWTAVRTSAFFLLKDKAEPDRAVKLIETVKKNLKI